MQLSVYQKTHEKFECDKCDCVYNYEGLLEKHSQAVYGSMKIFCNFFNNDKDCPYDDQCIFAHEDSPDCKFGKGCERILCMFHHEESEVSDDKEDDDDIENDTDNLNDNDENVMTIEDIEPCLKRVEEAMEKVKIALEKQALKCDQCDFEARNLNGLNMHKKAKHTNISK